MRFKQHLGTKEDPIQGTSGNDILQGSPGDDFLWGSGGNDELYGGDGNDMLRAGMLWNGSAWVDDPLGDKLYGGKGNDLLYGGAGADLLDGGTGFDLLMGGAGDDQYLIRDRHAMVADWQGKNVGLILADWVKPADGVEWTWAPGVEKLPYWIDALGFNSIDYVAGALGGKHTVYYSFAQAAASWFRDADLNRFAPFNQAQKAAVAEVLQYISSVVNVEFVETSDTGKPYSIVFGNNEQANSGGYASVIQPEHGSTLMLDYALPYQDPARDGGLALRQVLLHEIGHSLHLKHPFGHADADGDIGQGPFLPDGEDMKLFSVMSYTRDEASAAFASYAPFDLAALHYAYGVAPGARAGNDTYVLDPAAMNLLWDGNGYDTVDGSALAQDLVLDLRPGYWSFIGKQAATIGAAGQVSVNFGTVLEAALGGRGSDLLWGNEADNTLAAGAGHDVLAGLQGNDKLDGGSGIDVAYYAGKRADYSVLRNGAGATVAGVTEASASEGRDTLAGVERLRFTDTSVALDVDGINGQLYRLYRAAFDRKPDAGGLGFWVAMADRGVGLKEVAAAFTAGAEFAALYGAGADDASFLAQLYTNVLHRQYDQGGFDFWLKALKSGYARESVLIDFADSPENVAAVATLIANGFEYTPFSA